MLKRNNLIILISILFLIFILSLAACCRPKQDMFIVKEVGDELIVIGMSEEYKAIEELNFPITIYHNKKDRKIIGIGECAFKEYKNLKKVYLPDDIKTIGKEAFCGCKKLESINLPIGLLEIGEKAFSNSGLKRIDLEKRNINIQNDAFAFSEKLVLYTGCRKINKPSGWSEFAFRNVSTYWNYVISKEGIANAIKIEPEKEEYIAYDEIILDFSQVDSMWLYDAFQNDALINFNVSNQKERIIITNDIVLSLQEKEMLQASCVRYEINSSGTGYIVAGFTDEAYLPENRTKYKNLSFLETYTECDVTLPVVEIKDYAFHNTSIEIFNIVIHGNIERIGKRAFSSIDSLQNVKVKEGAKFLGELCFEDNSMLNSVDLPNSIEIISEGVFAYCSSIVELNLSNTQINVINENVFDNMDSLVLLNLPNNVKTIKSNAIRYCTSLKNLNLPDSIVTIDGGAILCCPNLEKINIPLNYIPQKVLSGDMPFEWSSYLAIFGLCPKLNTIEGTSTANYTLSNNALIVENCLINLGVNSNVPNGIEEICPFSATFNRISNLVIPASVERIGLGAFANFAGSILNLSKSCITKVPEMLVETFSKSYVSKLEFVILPISIVKIESLAFAECRKLKSIKFSETDGDGFSIPTTITDIGGYAFSGCDLLKINTNKKKTEKPIGWDEDCFNGVLEGNITWLS